MLLLTIRTPEDSGSWATPLRLAQVNVVNLSSAVEVP